MDIILIPGFWLDGSSWDEVVPVLQKARPDPRSMPSRLGHLSVITFAVIRAAASEAR